MSGQCHVSYYDGCLSICKCLFLEELADYCYLCHVSCVMYHRYNELVTDLPKLRQRLMAVP